ncbi:hypothetical protein CEW83_09360 [Parazoarcus communis]|uniref:Uncharacterized protein n=1 Tax=Parazoarcus communis TaxID=41977 RepID=A0A2U8GSB5_9RHOO|nr:hypothetical protein [Parazoarcus communis]AWI75395.1 hypothetical protein CEW83_09360 [Parazoarcus communis]
MAIGWITLLKTVPWADVIATAPVVADGAKRLWKTVGRKTQSDTVATDESAEAVPADADAATKLQSRLLALENTSQDLHAQMLASSELINALAEQNTELVKRVEANRVRLLWLSVSTLVTTAAVVLCLILLLRA